VSGTGPGGAVGATPCGEVGGDWGMLAGPCWVGS